MSVPGDVSVVSFDDSDLASWLRPQLASVALPHYEMGYRAMYVLNDMASGKMPPDPITPTEIPSGYALISDHLHPVRGVTSPTFLRPALRLRPLTRGRPARLLSPQPVRVSPPCGTPRRLGATASGAGMKVLIVRSASLAHANDGRH